MDYKYIEQLLERYWDAETTREEENILRAFFSQEEIPAEMEPLRPLFTIEREEPLGDDFDERIMKVLEDEMPKAQHVSLRERLMPLFKAAAIVAIVISVGGALQAPWDSSWNTPEDYAALQRVDTVATVEPVQAEYINGDAMADSTNVMQPMQPKD